jgi:hypothetical protein
MAESFELNFQDTYEIDITPLSSPTYVRLAVGISGADPDNNENLAQDTYLDQDGYGSTDVIGAQHIVSFSGHRVVGNPAQDYIASMKLELGDARKTHLRYTDAGGNQISGSVTMANIKEGGGDAGAKKDFTFEAHYNGKPTFSAHTAAPALSPTIATGTALGTTKFTVSPTSPNTLSYKLGASSLGTVYGNQYVTGDIGYASGSDIVASVGQYLQMFEINSFGRVVKYLEHQLVTADVNPGT